MTISSTGRKAGPFIGNGVTTSFPFTFKVFATSDVVVTLTVIATGVESTLTETADYTVALNADQNANPGGTVAYNPSGTPMAATRELTLTSAVPQLQTLSLTNGGGFFPLTISDALDRCVILIQQLALTISRGLVAAVSDTAPGPLPTAAARANNFLAFDSSGNPVAATGLASSPVSAAMAPVVTAATVAAGRAAMGVAPAATAIQWAISSGTADVIAAAYTPANAALTDGMLCAVKTQLTNITTTPTFAPDGLTPHTITKMGGAALGIGDIVSQYECLFRYNLAATRWEFLNPSQPGRLLSTTVYTAGSTWTKGANTNYIEVEVVSGGGGSGGCSGTSGVQVAASAGGSSGGYGFKKILAPASPQTITIGAAGTAGAAGSGGGTGGTSSFGAIVSVTGGTGSANGAAGGTVNQNGLAAGVSTGGDINISGEIGGCSLGNNSITLIKSGRGGSSPRGFGAGGQDISTAGNGQTATGFGAGASGSATTQGNGSGQAGALGTAGIIIVREYS